MRKCLILFVKRLAPQAGFEPATLRLTGGKRSVSRALLVLAQSCWMAHFTNENLANFALALCRGLRVFVAFGCTERARKGQPRPAVITTWVHRSSSSLVIDLTPTQVLV